MGNGCIPTLAGYRQIGGAEGDANALRGVVREMLRVVQPPVAPVVAEQVVVRIAEVYAEAGGVCDHGIRVWVWLSPPASEPMRRDPTQTESSARTGAQKNHRRLMTMAQLEEERLDSAREGPRIIGPPWRLSWRNKRSIRSTRSALPAAQLLSEQNSRHFLMQGAKEQVYISNSPARCSIPKADYDTEG